MLRLLSLVLILIRLTGGCVAWGHVVPLLAGLRVKGLTAVLLALAFAQLRNRRLHFLPVAARRAADRRRFIGEGVDALLFLLFLLVRHRVDELAVWADVNQAPFLFARHRVQVAPAQEADLVGVLQILHLYGELLEFAHVKLNCARILFAALDEHFLAIALRLKSNARQFHIQHQRDGRGHHVDQEHCKAGLAALLHPASCWITSVCCCLNCVSSITTDPGEMRITL